MTDTADINWGFNCLTIGVHHGRPEAIWNIPLLHATNILQADVLEELVIARIHSDATQFVEHGVDFDQAWADRIKEIAQGLFLNVLTNKVGELTKYYASLMWQNEQREALRRFKEGKLNPRYYPLHSHDTINLLCRIIGVSASRQAS